MNAGHGPDKYGEPIIFLTLDLMLLFAVVALFTGFVKAGLPALGALLSAIVALAFSPQEALGICLIYLLIGDVIAVSFYHRLAVLRELKKMIAPVLLGIAFGGLLLNTLDNDSLGLAIGLVVIFLVALEPLHARLTQWAIHRPRSVRGVAGVLAGVATTIGNAAGPIMSLYFLLLKLDKKAFVGTASIFFLAVNLTKVPIFVWQGFFNPAYFASIALTAPLVFAGAVLGRAFLEWIPQLWFKRVILLLTAIAGCWLIVRYFS